VKVATIVGARPQFIKAAAISKQFQTRKDVVETLIHTGQHYDHDMSDIFFEDFGLATPNYNLSVGSGSHGQQTARMLEGVESILLGERPDWVLVYGDTNSTLAGALAAAKLGIRIAHVEAGLRSRNRRMPEEINRVVTDHLSDLLFAPTEGAAINLLNEGIPKERVAHVGDVMLDVAKSIPEHTGEAILGRLQTAAKTYALATIHRAENTDDDATLRTIAEALEAVSKDLPVVFPLHPRTKKALARVGLLERLGHSIKLIEPVSYSEMLALERNAAIVITDSGGVQKEAFFFSVPCVTVREETEWAELVDLGWNTICPAKNGARAIAATALKNVGRRGLPATPYGTGDAAKQIVDTLFRST
jgi:UDP-GlcNAc3NAcA epimerase